MKEKLRSCLTWGRREVFFLVREHLGLVLKDSQTLARGRIEGYRISMLRHASGRIRNVHGHFQERKKRPLWLGHRDQRCG